MPQYNTKDEVAKAHNIYRNMYQDTTKKFSATSHIILLWKGSCCKLIWHDFAIFCLLYALISCVYRFVLFHNPVHRQFFEMLCVYANRFSSLIPITFLTGFYVSQVVTRWWDQFMSLPWPDRLALKLVSFCPGTDDFNKNLRRTVMRYVNLSSVLVYRLVSKKVADRFPNLDSLVEAKLMLPHEVQRLQKADDKTPHESTWVPILWAMKLLTRARAEGKIKVEPPIFANLLSNFEHIEMANRKILNYGWVNFPLAYVQVATISVFLYFFAALFGRQFLIPSEAAADHDLFPNLTIPFSHTVPFVNHTPDFYIPFFTLAELFCYMGWVKVAETLLNPFGDDDEDFQINYLIDRNLQVSYMIVDEADREMEVTADPFLEAGIDIPKELPYRSSQRMAIGNGVDTDSIAGSIASVGHRTASFMGLSRLSRFARRRRSSKVPLDGDANVNHALAEELGIALPPSRAVSRVTSINVDHHGGHEVMAESLPHNMKPGENKPPVRRMLTIPGSKESDLEEEEDMGVQFEAKKDGLMPPEQTMVMPLSMEPTPNDGASVAVDEAKKEALDGIVNDAFITEADTIVKERFGDSNKDDGVA